MGTLPTDSAVFGQDGDAAFAFNRVVVHHSVDHFFVFRKGARLAQQLIDHGGFAMVDVGNDGDISNL
jgi:hypothetical protein